MGKNNRRRKDRDDTLATSSIGDEHKSTSSSSSVPSRGTAAKDAPLSTPLTNPREQEHHVGGANLSGNSGSNKRRSFYQWCLQERQGIIWVLGCMLLGSIFGYSVGSGWLTGEYGKAPSTWRINLGGKIRSTFIYRNTLGRFPASRKPSSIDVQRGYFLSENEAVKKVVGITTSVLNVIPFFAGTFDSPDSNGPFSLSRSMIVKKIDSSELKNNPSHPYVYAVLREAITREKGGYVHPDLGFIEPAPCGAARGIGMVRNLYHRCQTRCVPGIAEEKLEAKQNEKRQPQKNDEQGGQRYMQEEVLIRVPLSFQMTRKVALDTLLPRITSEVQRKTVHELDDAALLVLLLAHERGVGQYSRWLPYIASLPHEPSCGYSQNLRPYLLDTINALRDELGMDVNGWPGELIRATEYSERIVSNLASDYGSFLQHPKGMSAKANIRWALCQVASRATGGLQKHGALRMIPMIDMLNHDAHAGGFVELTGQERLEKGDFVDAINEETDGGTFVVRSLRHGRRKALRIGQELMVNYNVPHYSALDWLVSSGFVPPERYQNWQKLDAPLPRIRRDGPFASMHENGKNSDGGNSRQEPSMMYGYTTAI